MSTETRRGPRRRAIRGLGLAAVGLMIAGGAMTGAMAGELPALLGLNQVGHLPGARKLVAVPADAAASASQAVVVDAERGTEVLRVALGPAREWAAADAALRLADVSALMQPGRYRVRVDGLPTSAAFEVGANAYGALAAGALKAFYFNRASIALEPAHAGPWARPAGHPDTHVIVHASAAGPDRPAGSIIASPKGWYDAGDYNKYIVNSGISVYTLLAAWEHFPAFFRAQRLNIPESGNGLPDLLNETLWNLDWMLSMQDPADGGVYHKLTNLRFDGTVMPHEATADRYVVGKSTAAALDFAATMAAASRVFREFEAQRPGYATRCLAAARRAWAWAQAYPDAIYRQPADVHTGEYGDAATVDEVAWAAAELYTTTGEPVFWRALVNTKVEASVPFWADVRSLAWITLAHHRDRLGPEADRRLIAERILTLADRLAAQATSSADGMGLQVEDHNWGSVSGVLNRAFVLVQGYRLSGQRAHLDAAQSLFDWTLGRNAMAMSLVTGFGERAPRHPHHRPSEADGVADPVPGFVVGGPNRGRPDTKGCPVPYASTQPALSYLDHFCSYASNEVAINWNAPLVYVAAALQVLTPPPAR